MYLKHLGTFFISYLTTTTAKQQDNASNIRRRHVTSTSANAEDPTGPYQIGKHYALDMTSSNTTPDKVMTEDGVTTWLYSLRHEGASYIAVHSKKIKMETSCTLTVASPVMSDDELKEGPQGIASTVVKDTSGGGTSGRMGKKRGLYTKGYKGYKGSKYGPPPTAAPVTSAPVTPSPVTPAPVRATTPDSTPDTPNNMDAPEAIRRSEPHVVNIKDEQHVGKQWWRHVRGSVMEIRFQCKDNAEPEFEIDGYVAGKPELMTADSATRSLAAQDDPLQRHLSMCTADDKKNAVCFETSHPTEYQRARAVARIYVNGSGACTGWLVSELNILITNHHCIKTQSDVMNSDFEFLGEEETCSTTLGDCWMCKRGEIYDGAMLLKAHSGKDYAVIKLAGDPASKYGHLELDNRPPVIGEQIYIPQHPAGRAKEIAFYDSHESGGVCRIKNLRTPCSIYRDVDNDVGYSCDTLGGTSGSPVIARDTQKVIALHHCGGGCGGNRGIRISDIYDELQQYLAPSGAGGGGSGGNGGNVGDDGGGDDGQVSCQTSELEFNLELTTDNYGAETSYNLKNNAGDEIIKKSPGDLKSDTTIKVNKCLPKTDCYTFSVHDVYDDGMCCGYGNGKYTVTAGSHTHSGGQFTTTDSTTFGESCPTPAPPTTVPPPVAPPVAPPVTAPVAAPCTADNFVLDITFDNYPEETSWELQNNADGNAIHTGNNYSGQTSFVFQTCLPSDACYTLFLYDSWSDGFCCSYGNGAFTATFEGTQVGSGATFESVKKVEFGNTCDENGGAESSAEAHPTSKAYNKGVKTDSGKVTKGESATGPTLESASEGGDDGLEIATLGGSKPKGGLEIATNNGKPKDTSGIETTDGGDVDISESPSKMPTKSPTTSPTKAPVPAPRPVGKKGKYGKKGKRRRLD